MHCLLNLSELTISHVVYLEASINLVYIIEAICVPCEKRNEFYVQSGTKFH